jgi:hypothetical protein
MNDLKFAIRQEEAQEFSKALSKKGIKNEYYLRDGYGIFETSNEISQLLEIYGDIMFRKGYERCSKKS